MAADYTDTMPRKTTPSAKPDRERKQPARGTGSRKPQPGSGKPLTAAAATAARLLTPAEVEEVFRRFAAANPEPKGELAHSNAFTLLVAVVLSAQATDAGVNKATPALFAVADTAAKMAALGEERLREYIKTVGLYPTKSRNIIALSRQLLAEHGGQVPRERAALEALPGVGRKSANVVLNVAFREPTIAVDTHIFRVANRTGLAPGKSPRHVEATLEARVPPAYKLHAHHWLILHGRYICKALKPSCERCLINDLCQWPAKRI
jgi:endonuclease III